MAHENINGINYTIRERVVNGRSQTIYYNDGKAYIKDGNGELRPLIKTKGSIFSKAEYTKASEYDYDGDGTITAEEQKKSHGQWMLMHLVHVLGEKWADTFKYAKTSLDDIVSKYITGDIAANNESEIKGAEEKILSAQSKIKNELLDAITQALHNKSAVRVNENIEMTTNLCNEYKANKDNLTDDEKKEYIEVAKKEKHLLSIEQKMHPQNKDLNDSIQKAIDMINETFDL